MRQYESDYRQYRSSHWRCSVKKGVLPDSFSIKKNSADSADLVDLADSTDLADSDFNLHLDCLGRIVSMSALENMYSKHRIHVGLYTVCRKKKRYHYLQH